MDNIDSKRTKVLINGEDVTNFVTFKYSHFIYYPDELSTGLKNVKVILIDDFGIEYNPIEWSFTAISQEDISIFDVKQSGKFKTDYSNSIVDTSQISEA